MLQTLRDSAHGIFAKILLGLLVLSFGVWGIGDMFRNGIGVSNVATVGGTPISTQAYQMALHRKQDELRQMLGNEYRPELLKRFGIEHQVLGTLVNGLLIAKEAAALGIVVSDDAVVNAIRSNPNFQDKDGRFDKSFYLATLRNNNLAEPAYVDNVRKQLAGRLIAETLTSGITLPDGLALALYQARAEQRTADILVVDAAAAGPVPEPTDKDITQYYDAHSKAFLQPEYRTLSYVVLNPADTSAAVTPSDADIKRAYDERAQDFRRPERRVIEAMLFSSQQDAQKAADKLAQGASFAEVAKTAPITNKGKLAVGTFTQHDAPPEAADAIFALKEGGSTPPVESSFGWHIFHVSKIEPESVAPLAEVRAQIVKDLSAGDAQEAMYKRVATLEDALAGGSTLEKAAEGVGAKVQTAGPLTREGVTADGKKPALPDAGFLSAAFSTAEKDHSAATQTNDGSYYLLRVDAVVPEHARPLAEVRTQVVDSWKAEKKQALVKTVSEDIATQLRAGKKLADVLAAHKLSLRPQASGPLKRSSEKAAEGPLKGRALPREMVIELFGLKPHATTRAYMLSGGDVAMIATLDSVIAAPAPGRPGSDPKALAAIRDELKSQVPDEMLHGYLIYLSGKYGVSINQAALGAKDEEGGE